MSFLLRGISNLVGIVVPIVNSFRVLKKPTNKKLIECMHYWCVYGSFLIVDWFLTTFFVSCFIPFYDFFVLMFTLLMVFPEVGFAPMLYTKFLAPLLRKYERRIDRIQSKLREKAWETAPGLLLTIPAVISSALQVFNQPAIVESTLEIEELDSSTEIRANNSIQTRRMITARLNRSFEVQTDDDDEAGDVFHPFPQRQIKEEVIESDELEDVVEPILRPMRRTQPPRGGRRATRSASVQQF